MSFPFPQENCDSLRGPEGLSQSTPTSSTSHAPASSPARSSNGASNPATNPVTAAGRNPGLGNEAPARCHDRRPYVKPQVLRVMLPDGRVVLQPRPRDPFEDE